jgi:16S rRNA processing protein RimM
MTFDDKDDLLPLGKINGVHGIKGALKVSPYGQSLSAFKKDRFILIRNKMGEEQTFSIKWISPYKAGILLSLKGVESRSQALNLIYSEILARKSDLPELEKGTYYWLDLIGLSVWTTDDKMIGCIETIIETGSNDVYVVKGKDKETLIPALESVVLDINIEKKTMRVDLPDGL